MGMFQDDTMVYAADGKLSAKLDRAWEIWGPNGGYLSAIALRAAGSLVPADHRPASYSCQYLSVGQFDETTVDAEAIRQGRNSWCVNVTLRQGERKLVQAQIWTTNKEGGPDYANYSQPEVPLPNELKPIEEYPPPPMPRHKFWNNFDRRPVWYAEIGEVTPAGAAMSDWYSYRGFEASNDVFLDCARPLLLVDVLQWPTFWRVQPQPIDYTAPTLALTVSFHEPPGESKWLYVASEADHARNGLIHGRTRVWNEKRRLVATGDGLMIHTPNRAK